MSNALEETQIIVPQIAYVIGRSARVLMKHNRMEALSGLNKAIGRYIMNDIFSVRPRLFMASIKNAYGQFTFTKNDRMRFYCCEETSVLSFCKSESEMRFVLALSSAPCSAS